MTSDQIAGENIAFKAEIKQLLNILIHSLYTDREIFLRELVSNASDSLNRVHFEMLTKREVLDPDAELKIHIATDPEARTLTITDTGVGMTEDELAKNLGTIAHSGVSEFIAAAKDNDKKLDDVIGQFGVGFYSVFMVAEWVRVTSRSYLPDARPAFWYASGEDTFTVGLADKKERGTTVEIKLKEDAAEFAQEYRIKNIIRKHSDFVAFPIYLNSSNESINQQTAIWRMSPREVTEEKYKEFYKQLTLFPEDSLLHVHLSTDAPVQVYALLYIPGQEEHPIFSLRKEDGLKLYSRKVLIREYTKELLPEYFRFVQGVVDSEDLPLNVSRESVQSNQVMARMKKILTSELEKALKDLASKKQEEYEKFWVKFGRFIKEGIATDQTGRENLYPLLRFHTSQVSDTWSSLSDYVSRMKEGQKPIYYLLGDDERSILRSPHMDYFQKTGHEVITFPEPIDSFMVMGLTEYEGHPFQNIASSDVDLPDAIEEKESTEEAAIPEDQFNTLIERFKTQLGDRVSDVRSSTRLSGSVARLVDPEGALNPQMQRVYRMMERNYETPKKILELNPRHQILQSLKDLPSNDELGKTVIEQIFESALLIDGIHPDPASMIPRIQNLMEAALKKGDAGK